MWHAGTGHKWQDGCVCTLISKFDFGVTPWPVNGNVYQGHFKNDAKEGMGVFYFKDRQSQYEGLWRNDIAQAGSYSQNADPEKPTLPFVMVPNSQHLEKECIRLALTRSLPPHYDRTTKRSDPAVCTRKYADVSYGSPLLA